VLEFVSGLLLTNGVPHFVEVVSGHRFQPPFGYLPGIGESTLLSNALWGFANLAADLFFSGSTCLKVLQPEASSLALGVLLAAVSLSAHFGGVRQRQAGKFSDRKRHSFDPLSPS
jgi:hypothetical protein